MKLYIFRDIYVYIMYYVYVTSGPSLLIESTDSMIYKDQKFDSIQTVGAVLAVATCSKHATAMHRICTHRALVRKYIQESAAVMIGLRTP